jgi:hypothetical protein
LFDTPPSSLSDHRSSTLAGSDKPLNNANDINTTKEINLVTATLAKTSRDVLKRKENELMSWGPGTKVPAVLLRGQPHRKKSYTFPAQP